MFYFYKCIYFVNFIHYINLYIYIFIYCVYWMCKGEKDTHTNILKVHSPKCKHYMFFLNARIRGDFHFLLLAYLHFLHENLLFLK